MSFKLFKNKKKFKKINLALHPGLKFNSQKTLQEFDTLMQYI